ncbi:MAG: hypothetical protein KBC43_08525 [Bacteroidales bacterium]|nr:hypothetical protein [Bacteroidales bacterium]
MKKYSLLIVALAFMTFAKAQAPTFCLPDAKVTVTEEQIRAWGEASQQNGSREVIVLDFEGVGDQLPIGNFYNGGAGPNYGIYFGGNTLGIIDGDAGGSGNFANEPSPNSCMFFLDGAATTMNVPAGFTTGFSFYYTSSGSITVYVYDNVDGTGNLLAQENFPPNYTLNCTGDPNGTFCHWDAVGISFAGTAKSVAFTGAANQCGFDDVTFGSITPGPVATPVSDWALFIGIGLILIFAVVRFRKII